MPSAMPPPKSVANTAIADTRRTSTAWSPQGEFMFPASRTRPNSKTNGVGVQVEDTRICVVMVGLPARGKSLIAQKGMCRWHNEQAWRQDHSLTLELQSSDTSAGSQLQQNASMSVHIVATTPHSLQQTSSTPTIRRASVFAGQPQKLPWPT